VEIRAVVSREGVVTNPVAISGPPVLRTAALAAVRKWRYEPSRLDGQPTERDLLITIAFHLPR
jgi:protein TonB